MDAYPKILRDVPDVDLAELVAERECLEQCSGLVRELITRWLAARDVIEWLQAEQQRALRVGGLGRDGAKWGPLASAPAAASAIGPRRPVADPAFHGA
ncbi:hypothetical protein GALL_367590 [mine drainage metagenome]|uniref:Uncharacterized protein n=1 Tax=mine drainage metagenome TaxID=410659 RepID=A0A1J5QVG5_9ZZZZ